MLAATVDTVSHKQCFAVGAVLRELNAVASVSIRNSLAFFPSGENRYRSALAVELEQSYWYPCSRTPFLATLTIRVRVYLKFHRHRLGHLWCFKKRIPLFGCSSIPLGLLQSVKVFNLSFFVVVAGIRPQQTICIPNKFFATYLLHCPSSTQSLSTAHSRLEDGCYYHRPPCGCSEAQCHR